MSSNSANSYWKSNLKIVASLLLVWFIASFGAGILFVDALDSIRFAGFKLGFWMAQQGSILVFVVLILVYIRLMDKLDARYAIDNADEITARSNITQSQKEVNL
jgi:putative solute:sodium symporter small subunit